MLMSRECSRSLLFSGRILILSAVASCTGPDPARNATIEMVVLGLEVVQDQETFPLGDNAEAVIQEAAVLDTHLSLLERDSANTNVVVRLRIDGNLFFERHLSASVAFEARPLIDKFATIASDSSVVLGKPADGVAVQAASLRAKTLFGRAWRVLCDTFGGSCSGEQSGPGANGVRG